MKIAIIDNSKMDREHLAGMIETLLGEMGIPSSNICLFANGMDFLNSFQKGFFDLLFLDIQIGEPDGIQVVQKVRKTDPVIKMVFLTASNNFASESYALGIDYYLLKPCTQAALKLALTHLDIFELEAQKILTLPDGQRLLLYSILYTAFFSHKVFIYRLSDFPLQVRCSQKDLENLLLPHPDFTLCNRGMIVNLNGVDKLESDRFIIKNGDSIPISRRKYSQVKNHYYDFLLEKQKRVPERTLFY